MENIICTKEKCTSHWYTFIFDHKITRMTAWIRIDQQYFSFLSKKCCQIQRKYSFTISAFSIFNTNYFHSFIFSFAFVLRCSFLIRLLLNIQILYQFLASCFFGFLYFSFVSNDISNFLQVIKQLYPLFFKQKFNSNT